MKDPIWKGVYDDFKEVQLTGPGYDDKIWVENSLKKMRFLCECDNEKKTIPTVTAFHESPLPVVAGIVYALKGSIKILDFGGGLGLMYYQVYRSLPDISNFEYHIVERESVCRAGNEYFRDDANIYFHPYLPDESERFDLVHMGSSIHYIEKWQDLLVRINKHQPWFLLFTDLPAGDIPTYASAQNFYGSKIPVWFFNAPEFIETLKKQGFKLVHKSTYVSKILGKEQQLPQENFDKKYRLGNSCILMFQSTQSFK